MKSLELKAAYGRVLSGGGDAGCGSGRGCQGAGTFLFA